MSFEPRSFLAGRKSYRALTALHHETLECRIALSATADAVPLAMDMPGHDMPDHDMPDHDMPDHDGHQMFGDVMVTPTEIHTHQEIIPRFAANPTITAVRNGNWSDPRVWSAGRVPVAGDRVQIGEGRVVVYSTVSNERIDSIEVSGSLVFTGSTNARLLVANLTIMPNGRLQAGSQANPIGPQVRVEITIADKPLDPMSDPRQFGTGLIGLGQISLYGAPIDATWNRLAAEPRAGDTSLLVSGDISEWKAGDTIVLPDSRQVPANDRDRFADNQISGQWEEITIERIEGGRIYLTEPLRYDHLGARGVDGQLELLPHVALLDRNLIIRSENPNGTRGHVLFTARADVDVEFTRFQGLGRTDAMRALDNATFDEHGMPTHIGTNQVGRYAVHFHHVQGPENPTNTGYQFRFVGNSVVEARKWGVAVHGTSFGLVDRNVVYDAQGAGIVTEDGSEIGNVFSNNITIRMQGNHEDGKDGTQEKDYGRGGSGFWFRRGGNIVTGNVASGTTYAGFVIDGYYTYEMTFPLFRGADVHDPAESYRAEAGPATVFLNNEAYGMSTFGLWMAFNNGDPTLPNQPPTFFADLRLWHFHNQGIVAYHTANVTFEGLTLLGDTKALDRNDTGAHGFDLTLYDNVNYVINNARIEGLYRGFQAPTDDASKPGIDGPTILRNSVLRNYVNIFIIPPRTNESDAGATLEVRNVKFGSLTLNAVGPLKAPPTPPANIQMKIVGYDTDWISRSAVRVYDYNQVKGDNFQVYYNEQAASFVLPRTNPLLNSSERRGELGAPLLGMTNAQAWERYGIAMAGAVAPAGATASRPEILGLVAPIAAAPVGPPRVVLVTPWDNAPMVTDFIRVRHQVIGSLPAGASVYFKLDDKVLPGLISGGIYKVPAGQHVLRAYIGDAQGRELPGTIAAVSRFTTYI